MEKKIIIAIDGFSSCGKSTLAKAMAKALEYVFVDTGAMYRAIALYFLRNKIAFNDTAAHEALHAIELRFKYNTVSQKSDMYLNGENVEHEIRVNPRVASAVSIVSAQTEVRKFLVKQQQAFGISKGIVMDGRDIGTVVFPQAELKLFITAEPNIRAQRRLIELKEMEQNTTFEEVLANLQKRDLMDTTRADSPLLKATDAIEIDNSNLSREDQLTKVLNLVKSLNKPAQ
jgi:cytidylate kinase